MPHSRHGIRYAGQAAGAGQETQLGTIERDHCLICGSPGLLACTATDMLTLFMLLAMSSLTQVSAESVGGITPTSGLCRCPPAWELERR
jgi:hypothetical protein